MPHTASFHKHAHPLHVGLLDAQAILFVTNSLTDLFSDRVALINGKGMADFMIDLSPHFYTADVLAR